MQPVMFSLSDIWTLLLAFCGAIVTISAAVVVITKIIERMKLPNKEQNERIDALEKSIKEIYESIELTNEQFRKDAERMDTNERAFKAASIVMIESLQALTAHAIDGNNTAELKESKKKLDTYLLNR